MRGRKPESRRSMWTGIATFALGTGLTFNLALIAQQPDPKLPDPKQIPEIKGKKVPGEPLPPVEPVVIDPNSVPPAPTATGPGAPLSAGGIFGVPTVNGYNAGSAISGTKIDMPLINYPGSIAVVPRDTIRDQQVLRTDDIIRDIGDAVKLGDFRRPDAMAIRGFELRSRDFRHNGFVAPSSVGRDFANIERVEVLKGPASFLYGPGGVGGMINYITKRPSETSLYNVNFQAGSFGLFRTTADVGGPLNEDKSILFRLNAAYETRDGWRDFDFNERTFAAPAITVMLSENTAVTFEGEYLNDRRRFDSGVVAINNQVGLVPIRNYMNEPNDFQRYNDYKTTMFLTHRFSDDTTGRIGFFTNWYDTPSLGMVPVATTGSVGFPGFPPYTLLRQQQNIADFNEQYYSIIADFTTKVCTGPVQHTLLAGTEIGWFQSYSFTSRLSDPLQPVATPFGTFPIPSAPLNPFTPVYGANPPTPGYFDADFQQNTYGFYLQDLMELNDRWRLLAGLRYDIADTHFARSLSSPFGGFDLGYPWTTTDATYYHLSPRVGLSYSPIKDVLSFYGAYALSFEPPGGGAYRNLVPLNPETGRIAEAGIKMNLFEQRLSLNAAGFHIVKNNVVTQDSFFFATQIGEQRSQGFELTAVGKVTNNWSLIANYAYVDARTVSDVDPLLVDKRLRNIPFNNVNLWSRYNLIDNCTHTLGAALGVIYQGERPGDLRDSFELPGFTRWDAGLFYRRGGMNASLYVENVFDRQYYTGSIDQFSVFPGAPTTLRAQVGLTF